MGTSEESAKRASGKGDHKQGSGTEDVSAQSDVIAAMQAFTYGEKPVRAVEKNGTAWFVAADVCDVLGIVNSRDAVEKLDEDEKGLALSDTPGGKQQVGIVSESGALYIIMRSDKPEAKAFRRWVTGVVLPAVLRTGRYEGPQTDDPNSPSITLPGPGRYVAEVMPDGTVRCELASYEEAATRIFFAEGQVLVHTLKLIQAHWSIVQQSRVFEDNPQAIRGSEPLHQAIIEGGRLATEFLPRWDLTARRQP